jgi:hypothetical protein
MFVYCVGSGLRAELITRSEVSYPLCVCVCVCVCEREREREIVTSTVECPKWAMVPQKKKLLANTEHRAAVFTQTVFYA